VSEPAATERYEQDPYTWAMFETDVRKLAWEINTSPRRSQITSIYGLARGGLPAAVALSHATDIMFLRTLMPGALVVDDNTITGESLRPFAESGYLTAVLVHNPEQSGTTPTFYARTMDGWPAFPWEIPCRR
jgi:adenine/guanine phosphoribosyltransferase-like PRPP-binding protein